jgi:hypothetical protein
MTRTSTLHRLRRRVGRQPRLENLEDRQLLSLPPAFDSVLGVGGTTSIVVPVAISPDGVGNTYVTGHFYGTTDFDPAVVHADDSDILTPKGTSDIFVAKYAPDNTLVWARRMGSDHVDSFPSSPTMFQFDWCGGLTVDRSGNAYVTGKFPGDADFGPFTLQAAGYTDSFVTKLGPDGTFLWAKNWSGANLTSGTGIAVDAAGNVLSVGDISTVYSNGSFINNGFEIHKYSPTGAAVWTKQIAGSGEASGVATDPAGNVYVCGTFKRTVDFNPDPRKTNYATGAADSPNGYVLKLTASGVYGWVAPFVAKTAQSPGAYMLPIGIALDPTGNIIIGGLYKGQVDFDPSPKIDKRLPNVGVNYDGFVAKLSPTGALAWATPLGSATVASVAVDGAGGIYATGSFYTSNGPFTPGFGLPPVTTSCTDAFVVGLTTAGSVDWALTYEPSGTSVYRDTMAHAIAVDPSGTIYVAGNNRLGTTDFDPEHPGTQILPTSSRDTMFLLKLKKR